MRLLCLQSERLMRGTCAIDRLQSVCQRLYQKRSNRATLVVGARCINPWARTITAPPPPPPYWHHSLCFRTASRPSTTRSRDEQLLSACIHVYLGLLAAWFELWCGAMERRIDVGSQIGVSIRSSNSTDAERILLLVSLLYRH